MTESDQIIHEAWAQITSSRWPRWSHQETSKKDALLLLLLLLSRLLLLLLERHFAPTGTDTNRRTAENRATIDASKKKMRRPPKQSNNTHKQEKMTSASERLNSVDVVFSGKIGCRGDGKFSSFACFSMGGEGCGAWF
jgi:hypothetical protein